MEFGGIVVDLGTVAGVALITSLLVQFFVKKGLKSYQEKDWYGLAINASTLVIAILITYLGTMISDIILDRPQTGNAILRALLATVAAIGGYEGVSNAWKTIQKPQKDD